MKVIEPHETIAGPSRVQRLGKLRDGESLVFRATTYTARASVRGSAYWAEPEHGCVYRCHRIGIDLVEVRRMSEADAQRERAIQSDYSVLVRRVGRQYVAQRRRTNRVVAKARTIDGLARKLGRETEAA